MVNSREELIAVRRRMVVEGLQIRPRDLRDCLRMKGPYVSFILRGHRKMTPQQRALFNELVQQKVQELFS